MTMLIVMALVCLGFYSVLACLKSNAIWVNRKKGYQPQDRMSREVLRAWRYNKSFNEPDPWLLPVSDEALEPIFGLSDDRAA